MAFVKGTDTKPILGRRPDLNGVTFLAVATESGSEFSIGIIHSFDLF